MNALKPPMSLLCKLGLIATAHDWAAARALIADKEVQEWLADMAKHSLLPVKPPQFGK
jgi:hypothetical protein